MDGSRMDVSGVQGHNIDKGGVVIKAILNERLVRATIPKELFISMILATYSKPNEISLQERSISSVDSSTIQTKVAQTNKKPEQARKEVISDTGNVTDSGKATNEQYIDQSIKKIDNLNSKIKELNDHLDNLSEVRNEVKNNNAAANEKEKLELIDDLNRDIEQLKTSINKFTGQREKINIELRRALNHDTEDATDKEIVNEKENNLKEVARVVPRPANLDSNKESVEKTNSHVDYNVMQIAEFNKEIKNINNDLSKIHKQKDSKINELKINKKFNIRKSLDKLRKLNKEAKNLVSTTDRKMKEMQSIIMEKLIDNKQDIGKYTDKLHKLSEEIYNIVIDLNEKTENIHKINNKRAKNNSKVVSLNKKLDELNSEYADKMKERNIKLNILSSDLNKLTEMRDTSNNKIKMIKDNFKKTLDEQTARNLIKEEKQRDHLNSEIKKLENNIRQAYSSLIPANRTTNTVSTNQQPTVTSIKKQRQSKEAPF